MYARENTASKLAWLGNDESAEGLTKAGVAQQQLDAIARDSVPNSSSSISTCSNGNLAVEIHCNAVDGSRMAFENVKALPFILHRKFD